MNKIIGALCLCLALQVALAQNASPERGIHRILNPVAPAASPIAPGIPSLVFDAETKQYNAKPGEMIAPFTFNLTNLWTNEIRIDQVHASCGCTTAKLPETPWHLAPGAFGKVEAQVNLAGKPAGTVVKTLTFFTSVGNRVVNLRVVIPSADGMLAALSPDDRKAAMMKAATDARAIFHGDCAKCHVDKGVNTFGQNLYAADCAICHESPHRDTAVPDLHALKQPTGLEYWKTMIAYGKAHTMMPGFAIAQGGPLTDEQTASLASYLNRTISHNFGAAPAPIPDAKPQVQ